MDAKMTLRIFSVLALILGITGLLYLFLIMGETNNFSLFAPSMLSFLVGSGTLTYLAFFKK